MRISLIDPPGRVKGLNVGLGYLASSLIRKGHQVKVLDINNNSHDVKERLRRIRNSDVIGVSVKSSTAEASGEIGETLGRKDLACGGAHITIGGKEFLRENSNFKFGAIGEAEETLPDLVNAIENRRSLREVQGIIFKDRTEIELNPRRPFILDLDSLPDPNYELFDSFKGRIEHYPLVTSRGCPHNCIYCCVSEVSGKIWRGRSPKRIIEELENARSKYKTRSFEIVDDNFTNDMRRAKQICQLIIDHKLEMKWACYNGIRADKLDDELVTLMKDSGCNTISIGVESLNLEVFSGIGKGESLEDIRHAVTLLNEHGIEVEGSFIIGLPGDTLEKTIRSIEVCKEMHFNKTMWNLFVPYPGTKAWSWVNREGKILRDWKEGFHFGPEVKPVFETKNFTEEERIYAYKIANVKCKGYFALLDAQKSLLANAFDITKLVLKYDARNVVSHIRTTLRNAAEARARIKEYEKIV